MVTEGGRPTEGAATVSLAVDVSGYPGGVTSHVFWPWKPTSAAKSEKIAPNSAHYRGHRGHRKSAARRRSWRSRRIWVLRMRPKMQELTMSAADHGWMCGLF